MGEGNTCGVHTRPVDTETAGQECECLDTFSFSAELGSCGCGSMVLGLSGRCEKACGEHQQLDAASGECVCAINREFDGSACVCVAGFHVGLDGVVCMAQCPRNAVVDEASNQCQCREGYLARESKCVRHLTKKQVGALAGSLCGVFLIIGLVILTIWLVKRAKHRKAQKKLNLDAFIGKKLDPQPVGAQKKDAPTPIAFELGTLPNSVRPDNQ